MEYIKEGSTLPIPFNIIPTPKSILLMIKRIKNFITKDKEKPSEDAFNVSQMRRDGVNLSGNIHSNGKVKIILTTNIKHKNYKSNGFIYKFSPILENNQLLTMSSHT